MWLDTYEGIRIFLARHSFMDINNVCVCAVCFRIHKLRCISHAFFCLLLYLCTRSAKLAVEVTTI